MGAVMSSCRICGNYLPGEIKDVNYPGASSLAEGPKNILLCPNCGSGVADPMLSQSELDALYQGSSYWNESDELVINQQHFPVPFALAKARWNTVGPYLKKARPSGDISILDIGAGHGVFGLRAANKLGRRLVNYTAVEPDPVMRQAMQKAWDVRHGGEISAISDLADVSGSYDLVVLSHVLEHVSEPKEFMEMVLQKVKAGGVIFVEIPNQDYLFKKNVFPHLLFFTEKGLVKLLGRCGLGACETGIWGRDMAASPLGNKNSGPPSLFSRVVERLMRLLPGFIAVKFYDLRFGMNISHPQGTWIRALATKEKT